MPFRPLSEINRSMRNGSFWIGVKKRLALFGHLSKKVQLVGGVGMDRYEDLEIPPTEGTFLGGASGRRFSLMDTQRKFLPEPGICLSAMEDSFTVGGVYG